MAQYIEDDDEEIIDSYEKFIKHQGLVDWPLVTLDENFEISDNSNYKSSAQIFDYLKVKVPFPVEITNLFTKTCNDLWLKMKEHEHSMSHSECKKTEEVLINEKFNMYVEKAHKRMKEQSEIVAQKFCIKDCHYPGFCEVQTTNIPGQPDSFQLLDLVSDVQGFNSGFLKIWKPFFVSHVSVSIFKDTFWWFFLHQFKTNMEEEENNLFDRIAGTFVSLLMTVEMNLKDKLFKMYANCLAQAVYTSFYKAFPASLEQFRDEFKQELADLIYFWVSGVKPKLFSWQSWNLAELCPADKEESVKDSASEQELPFEELVSQIERLSVGSPTAVACDNTPGEIKVEPKKESHFFGPGPQFQHVSFQQCGQSPLVLRYLQNCGIPALAGSFTQKMRRTEISSMPPCKPTYQDVMSEMETQRNKRVQQHNTLCKQTKEEIEKIHRVNAVNKLTMNRLQNEIFSNRIKLKIASEGIMSYWDNPPPYRQRQPKGGKFKKVTDETKNPEQPPDSLKEKEATNQ